MGKRGQEIIFGPVRVLCFPVQTGVLHCRRGHLGQLGKNRFIIDAELRARFLGQHQHADRPAFALLKGRCDDGPNTGEDLSAANVPECFSGQADRAVDLRGDGLQRSLRFLIDLTGYVFSRRRCANRSRLRVALGLKPDQRELGVDYPGRLIGDHLEYIAKGERRGDGKRSVGQARQPFRRGSLALQEFLLLGQQIANLVLPRPAAHGGAGSAHQCLDVNRPIDERHVGPLSEAVKGSCGAIHVGLGHKNHQRDLRPGRLRGQSRGNAPHRARGQRFGRYNDHPCSVADSTTKLIDVHARFTLEACSLQNVDRRLRIAARGRQNENAERPAGGIHRLGREYGHRSSTIGMPDRIPRNCLSGGPTVSPVALMLNSRMAFS